MSADHPEPVTFRYVVSQLAAALERPLPGPAGQRHLAPRGARMEPTAFDAQYVKDAAGLVLAFPRHHEAHIVLTVRGDDLGRHAGQVSLPGGALEPGETYEDAAQREAREEIGLSLQAVRMLGRLSPVDVVVSGFRLHPVVAYASKRPRFLARHGEVARILEVPIRDLMDPSKIVWRSLRRGETTLTYPAFAIEGTEIWGATAMVLSELLTLLGWLGL